MKWNSFWERTQHKKNGLYKKNWLRKLIYTICWCGLGFESTHEKWLHMKNEAYLQFSMRWNLIFEKIDRVHSNQLNTQRCTMLNDWLTMPRFIAVRKNSTRAKTQSAIKKNDKKWSDATIYRRPSGATINRDNDHSIRQKLDEFWLEIRFPVEYSEPRVGQYPIELDTSTNQGSSIT